VTEPKCSPRVTFINNTPALEDLLTGYGKVSGADTNPVACVGAGAGLTLAVVGKPATFIISAFDWNGGKRTVGGDTVDVTLFPTHKSDEHVPIRGSVKDNGDGSYSCEYMASTTVGAWRLDVRLNGSNIKGSPFHPTLDVPAPTAVAAPVQAAPPQPVAAPAATSTLERLAGLQSQLFANAGPKAEPTPAPARAVSPVASPPPDLKNLGHNVLLDDDDDDDEDDESGSDDGMEGITKDNFLSSVLASDGEDDADADADAGAGGEDDADAGAPAARFSAVYDYVAADQDEVSFTKGDEILSVREASPGWVIGVVKRTGMEGMLPSNYLVTE